jgi:hypothetical protein
MFLGVRHIQGQGIKHVGLLSFESIATVERRNVDWRPGDRLTEGANSPIRNDGIEYHVIR